MTPTFEKLKKGGTLISLIKAVMMGLAAGMLAVGAILLTTKLAKFDFPIPYTVLIGVGAMLIAAAITFLILFRTAKAVAKNLDDGYELRERVQTMLEFRNDGSAMAGIQRQDAEDKLKEKTGGKARIGKIWISATALVLSAALMITAIVLPADVVLGNQDSENEEIKLTSWHYTSMLQLIEYVNESPMHANLKPTVRADIEDIVDDVFDYDEQTQAVESKLTRTQTVQRINDSIVYLDNSVEEFNTYKRLYKTLMGTQSKLVVDFAYALRALETTEHFISLREKMDDQTNFDVSAIALATRSFANEISGSFAQAQDVPATDELYLSTIAFTAALNDAVSDTSKVYLLQQNAIDNAFSAHQDAIANALDQQDESRLAINYVIAELVKIFEIKNPPPTGGETLTNIEISDDGSGNDSVSGAPGSGGVVYGSNEEIYYPDDQEYKKYGDVYNEYDAKREEIAEEENAPDEIKEILDKYFDKLGTVSGNKTEQNP